MDRPESGLNWLWARKGQASDPEVLLRRLARGDIDLTHEAFHDLRPWRAAEHLRELLVACGVLPAIDKQVCLFERWPPGHPATISDEGRAQVIRRFAIWDVPPRLRARAERRPVTTVGRRYAGEQVKTATAFLGWLSARGAALADCRQADVDARHAEHVGSAFSVIRPFLLWCMATKLTRRFRLPQPAVRHAAPLPDNERTGHLGRVLTALDLLLQVRAAAAIVLLYAQPVSRMVRLMLDDVIHDGDSVLLRLGERVLPGSARWLMRPVSRRLAGRASA